MPMQLFHPDLATDHLIGGRTANKRFPRKHLATTRTDTGSFRVVHADSFPETFDQCAFSAFAVAIKLMAAPRAEDIDGGGRAFCVGFCHVDQMRMF